MEVSIYSSLGDLLFEIDYTKNCRRSGGIMSDNYLEISFKSDRYIPFKAGCFIEYKGEKFYLYRNYYPENTTSGYAYEMKFYDFTYRFKSEPLFNYVLAEDGVTYVREPEITLTETLNGFGRWIVMCINKELGTNYEYVETPIEDVESDVILAKTITFSEGSILSSIEEVTTIFETEYWFDKNKLHFTRCEREDVEVLVVGENNGLRDGGIEFNDDNADPIPTKIYAYGGERNIRPKYNSEGIAYDKRLTLPKGIEYVEFAGADVEVKVKRFYDDIYPRKVFTISGVRVFEAKNEDEIDTYYITLADIDFNVSEHIIDTITPAIAFQSGRLIGRDFDVEYNSKSKEFKIISTADGDYDIPQGIMIPAIGDRVILYNIEMPEQYKLDAQEELRQVAQKEVDDLNRSVQDITLKSDKYNWEELGRSIVLGQKVKLIHERYASGFVTSRVKSYSYPLDNECDVEFVIGDATDGGVLDGIKDKISDAVDTIEKNRQQIIGVSRRGWRASQELLDMFDGVSAEVAVIAKGPEAQFAISCIFIPNYRNANSMRVLAGVLQHVVYKDNEQQGLWNIASSELTRAYDSQGNYNDLVSGTPYYVYARCSKTNDTGAIILYDHEVGVEDVNGYYMFPVGALSSVIDNARVFNTMYGYTQINGGSITTGILQSLGGKSYWDLDNNKLRIGDEYSSIDVNVSKEGRITLHNLDILSDSGDVSHLGVFRGPYNNEYVYYTGDEVSYSVNGAVCTYRYINATPSKGHLPTDTFYWEVVAKGEDGKDGADGNDGADGASVTISETSVMYQKSLSGTVTPTGTWLTGIPTTTAGEFLWARTIVRYSDGTSTTSYSVSVHGANGNDGQNGQDGMDGTSITIRSHSVTYAVTATSAQPADSAFTTDQVPSLGAGDYLWSKTVVVYSDGTTTKSYSVSRIGADGENGMAGANGIDGQTTYVHIAYANNATGTIGFSTTYFAGALYIGTCTDYNQKDPTSPSSYVWARLKGEDGKDGADGNDGADGGDGSASEFYEYRYAKNGSTSTPPVLDFTNPIPAGWSTIPPDVGPLEYLWMTTAKKSTLSYDEEIRMPVTESDITSVVDTVSGCNGIITDNVSLVNDGNRCAINLGGNANCRIPYDLPFGRSFTLCMWIKPSQDTVTWMLSGKSYDDTIDGSFSVSAGSWCHLSFRFSNRSVAIFKDGSMVQSGAVQEDVIGFALYDDDVFGLSTLYDDIYLFNRALSQNDIEKVMNDTIDSLLRNWTKPVRITPQDGNDGAQGESPVVLYRGVFDPNKKYYGTKYRLDAVKYNGTHHITRIDAGEFSGVVPTDATKWNPFGAELESIATNLLLAEGANIGDWFMSGGKIVSTLESGNKITLDARNAKILIEALATTGLETGIGSTINLEAANGVVEVRSKSGREVSYLSPNGIFANKAGTQCVPTSSALVHRAAIAGIGFANQSKSTWDTNADQSLVAGVYGDASNSGDAPSFGGVFYNLFAIGLILKRKAIIDISNTSYDYLYDGDTLVIGYNSKARTIYLPLATREGQTIIFKQWWSGSMRVYPRGGQKLYDDNSANDYYDVTTGQMMIAVFTIGYLSGSTKTEAWLVSKFKY